VTLLETMLAFVIGTGLGLGMGLWLALSPVASALLDPYIKALNSMPRVILAPIFAVWFGLDIASKVALGVTLVFFIVFFNVYQGVREVSYTVLANARILGCERASAPAARLCAERHELGLRQPAQLRWPRLRRRGGREYLGSSRGVGYLILQAEASFDINSVFAGILVLTAFALLLDWAVSLAEPGCWFGSRAAAKRKRSDEAVPRTARTGFVARARAALSLQAGEGGDSLSAGLDTGHGRPHAFGPAAKNAWPAIRGGNRTGAGGNIGTDVVAKAAPDGHTPSWRSTSGRGEKASVQEPAV